MLREPLRLPRPLRVTASRLCYFLEDDDFDFTGDEMRPSAVDVIPLEILDKFVGLD